jgi:hypothetical protein
MQVMRINLRHVFLTMAGLMAATSLLFSFSCASRQLNQLLDSTATNTPPTSANVPLDKNTPPASIFSTPLMIETPQKIAPPIVRISDNNYAAKDMVSLQHLAEDSTLVGKYVLGVQAYVDSAIDKADKLKLNDENLKDILTKLVMRIDQLDFEGKNAGENGVQWTFMLSKKTVQLPYLIESASYQGKKAWFVVLNWEMNTGNLTHGSHVAIVAFEYGTDKVLFAMSCA